ncbi:MAG: energy transducer TonB, partial [Stellaceae bacterium]
PQAKPAPPPPPPPVPMQKPTPPKPAPRLARAERAPHPPPPKPRPTKPRPEKAPAKTQSFDNLLRNLEKDQPSSRTNPAKKPVRTAQRASSQPVAPLASQLLASQLDLVKEQIEQCWAIPAGVRHAADLQPEFRVVMNPDATVRSAMLMNTGQYGNPAFRAAADSARRALLNRRCQPLKLPLNQYAQWQTFTITFDPKDVN